MYFETIKQLQKMLRNFSAMLDKASQYAESRSFNSANYLTARLAPDMFPFARQVQSICDGAKYGAARLAGKEAPRHEDNEQTLAELQTRLKSVIEYIDTYKAEDFAGAAERRIVLPWMKGQHILGQDYLMEFMNPNFYFHLSMAYALLRQAGVAVGKLDYLGNLNIKQDTPAS